MKKHHLITLSFLMLFSFVFHSCSDELEIESPDQYESRIVAEFFNYRGDNPEIQDAITDFRSRYGNQVILDIYQHAGVPRWEEMLMLSDNQSGKRSESADSDQSYDVENQFPVLHEDGTRTEALLVYFKRSSGEKFWKVFSRKHYERFDFKTKLELQPMLVASQFLGFDNKIFGVSSIEFGEYTIRFEDSSISAVGDPCEFGDLGCNCIRATFENSNGHVLGIGYVNCTMMSHTVTPDDQNQDDGLDTNSGGNDTHYYHSPVVYDPPAQSYVPKTFDIFFRQIYTSATGLNYVNDFSSNPEHLLEDIDLESDLDVDFYLREGPSNSSRGEVSHYLLLMSNVLFEHDNSKEFAFTLNELSRNQNLTDAKLYDLALETTEIYKHLSNNAFDYDLLSHEDQADVSRRALLVDIYPEMKENISNNGWPLSGDEWEALWVIFKPMLGELLIEAIPGGGITLAFRDAVTGINNGDVYLVSGAVAGLILEFIPPGKVFKAVWRTGRVVRKGFKFVKYSRRYLRSIGHALEAGLKADLDGSIVRISKNSDEIGIIKNGDLVPNKYGSSGSPIGHPEGGYQLHKNGDNYQYKRTPDLSGYSQADLSKLKNHPNAHTLERHGHDVTDEALIKRANTGIAPDGSTLSSPPNYSSKFNTIEDIKRAITQTGPESSTFASTPNINGTKTVIGTSSTPFGKGVTKYSTSFQSSNKVRAIYKLHEGTWKLLSMYPDF